MIKTRVLFIILLVVTSSISTHAQIKTNKKPKFNLLTKTALSTMKTLPKVDIKLTENDSKRAAYQFGTEIPINYTLNNSGQWQELDNGGRIWALSLYSENAKGITIIYDDFFLPSGAELNLYSKEKDHHLGAFTHQNNKENQQMATQPIIGDTIILELYEPKKARGLSRLSLEKAIHINKDSFLTKTSSNFENSNSGYCNIDVSCEQGDNWTAEIKSTAMFQIGTGFCSGTIINNSANNQAQYFLTAQHCVVGKTNNLGSTIFYYNWQRDSCDSDSIPEYDSTVGAELIFIDEQSDVALLKITTSIPESYDVNFAGWDRTDTNHTNTTVLHHPKGDVKKISLDTDSPVTSNAIIFDGMVENSVWEVIWDEGTTESGSSGSGLYNQNYHLIGQLSGGSASCINQNQPDYFGKLSLSWDLGINAYLDPLNLNPDSINTLSRVANSYDVNLDGVVNDNDIKTMINIVTNTNIDSSSDSTFNTYSSATIADILHIMQQYASE